MKNILVISLLFVGLVSCMKEPVNQDEDERIQNYLEVNDIDAEKKESGLYYLELIEGTGPMPVDKDTVEVYYTGEFLDGRVFTRKISGDPYAFVVGMGEVIEGWDEGIKYMKEGEEAMIILPSWLAYGATGTYGISGYTPLVFFITLDRVIPGPDHQ
ncbi:MAG TPA: FKBP-type peptidyl-prolyl cis-trans isomerase [Bacteroidales bacterium]|nr:FKBP-type peptidyl-prolyl cis-trans isomerase [Bacteroidales bacterium]